MACFAVPRLVWCHENTLGLFWAVLAPPKPLQIFPRRNEINRCGCGSSGEEWTLQIHILWSRKGSTVHQVTERTLQSLFLISSCRGTPSEPPNLRVLITATGEGVAWQWGKMEMEEMIAKSMGEIQEV